MRRMDGVSAFMLEQERTGAYMHTLKIAILETGVCEVDPELLAGAVQDSTRGPRLPAMPETRA